MKALTLSAVQLAVAILLTILLPIQALATVTKWVEFELVNGHIQIPTKIAGIEGYSIIDTGASINSINSRFLKANDLKFKTTGDKVRIHGVASASVRRMYTSIPVEIFDTEIPFRELVDLSLGSPDLQLIIGAGFLQLFIFQFDYPNQRLRAITRDSMSLKKQKNVTSKRDRDGGAPLVKVNLNGQRDLWLLMDTGSNGGVLMDRIIAKKEGWLDEYPRSQSTSRGVNSSFGNESFNLPFMKFGPFEIEKPIITVPARGKTLSLFERVERTGSNLKRSRNKFQGLLGYDVLKHFVVTIDYKAGHVHIAPPE